MSRDLLHPEISSEISRSPSAERIHASVVRWIETHLKVEVNRDKSGSGPSDSSGLLGFRIYRDGRVGVAPKAFYADWVAQLLLGNLSETGLQLYRKRSEAAHQMLLSEPPA